MCTVLYYLVTVAALKSTTGWCVLHMAYYMSVVGLPTYVAWLCKGLGGVVRYVNRCVLFVLFQEVVKVPRRICS